VTDKIVDLRDVRFVLHEVLKVERLLERDRYAGHSSETVDLAIDAAYKLAREVFWPAYREMDEVGARFDPATRKTAVPEAMHRIWAAAKEGGWFGVTAEPEYGGQGLPSTVGRAIDFILNAANTAAHMYIGAASGAAHLIQAFGDAKLRETYVAKLFSGEWAATMALTEPQAGSSLSDVRTSAVRAKDGDHYLLAGTKVFISSGDHDLAENIVHPVLARLPDAPLGVKGISLFIVPKYRPRPDGGVGEFNDVVTGGIEHKLGLRGQATATLHFGESGDCRGWLMGEPHKGLAYMFQLMNGARIATGLQAASVATNAYQHALAYARERRQGRAIQEKDPATPQIPIIRHADVRRMLLAQKAYTEGMFALLAYCAYQFDLVRAPRDADEKERALALLEILTPVCKAYGSDVSFASTALAIQVHGGYGFSEELPLAQMLRDQKVFSIYEGTNSIQAMDLLGRKVPMKGGAAFRAVVAEMLGTIQRGRDVPALSGLTDRVHAGVQSLVATTQHLATLGGDPTLYMTYATPYLQAFSQVVIAWQLLESAIVAQKALDGGAGGADFYRGKIAAAEHYARNDLAVAQATAGVIQGGDRVALDARDEWF
jgi:butyryl-CoA dehydrogenase